jgi:hypothetical protein
VRLAGEMVMESYYTVVLVESVQARRHAHTHMHTHTYTHMHTHIHTRIHTHTHMHTHIQDISTSTQTLSTAARFLATFRHRTRPNQPARARIHTCKRVLLSVESGMVFTVAKALPIVNNANTLRAGVGVC